MDNYLATFAYVCCTWIIVQMGQYYRSILQKYKGLINLFVNVCRPVLWALNSRPLYVYDAQGLHSDIYMAGTDKYDVFSCPF